MKYINLAGYIAIPLAFGSHFFLNQYHDWEPILTFILAAMGVIPLAHMMGESTEQLSEKTGPTWGGLLNATFGNAAELIIGVIALSKGLNEMVKASLTGSVIGNLLLVGGASMVVGGWKREKQTFNANAAEANAGLLTIAVAAMLIPAIFQHVGLRADDPRLVEHEHHLSIAASIILILIYAAAMLFTLRTHAHVLSRGPKEKEQKSGESKQQDEGPKWSVTRSIVMLLVAAAGIGFVAELLVGSAEIMAHKFGWNDIFVGVIFLAIIGNAAEHSTAMWLASRDDMDTAMTITYQSSLQIALFATPLLVLVSAGMTYAGWGESHYLNLLFTPLEVAAVMLSVLTVVVLGRNGETNWFEGVLLLGLYALLGVAFYYLPANVSGNEMAGG